MIEIYTNIKPSEMDRYYGENVELEGMIMGIGMKNSHLSLVIQGEEDVLHGTGPYLADMVKYFIATKDRKSFARAELSSILDYAKNTGELISFQGTVSKSDISEELYLLKISGFKIREMKFNYFR